MARTSAISLVAPSLLLLSWIVFALLVPASAGHLRSLGTSADTSETPMNPMATSSDEVKPLFLYPARESLTSMQYSTDSLEPMTTDEGNAFRVIREAASPQQAPQAQTVAAEEQDYEVIIEEDPTDLEDEDFQEEMNDSISLVNRSTDTDGDYSVAVLQHQELPLEISTEEVQSGSVEIQVPMLEEQETVTNSTTIPEALPTLSRMLQSSQDQLDASDISEMFGTLATSNWQYDPSVDAIPVAPLNETQIVDTSPVFEVDQNNQLLVNGDVAEYPEELKEKSLLPIVGWKREDETHNFVTFMLPTGKLFNATVEISQFESLANGDALSLKEVLPEDVFEALDLDLEDADVDAQFFKLGGMGASASANVNMGMGGYGMGGYGIGGYGMGGYPMGGMGGGIYAGAGAVAGMGWGRPYPYPYPYPMPPYPYPYMRPWARAGGSNWHSSGGSSSWGGAGF